MPRPMLVLLVATTALPACTRGTPPPLPVVREAGQVLHRMPTRPKTFEMERQVGDAPFAWRGSEARLDRRGTVLHPRSRLVVDAVDAAGGRTEFLVDTGSSDTFLATGSAAATTARVYPTPISYVAAGTPVEGRKWSASLPSLRVGELRGEDVPVVLVEGSHSRRTGGNLLGLSLLSGLALEHDAPSGRWTLRPGGGSAPRGTSVVSLEAPGLPVVAARDEQGRPIFAMIDTGAPWSAFERGTSRTRCRLLDRSGATAIVVDAKTEAPWRGLRAGGRPIGVWIGLDALERRSWVIDFSTGTWTFLD